MWAILTKEAVDERAAPAGRAIKVVFYEPLQHRLVVDGHVQREEIEQVLANRYRPDVAGRRAAVTVSRGAARRYGFQLRGRRDKG